ncbi:MAG TPA: hypothetical protein VFQ43_17855 [Nitrososphaera sp.]|nr:hypothetical protein [Nitrososphaera sp.]
MCYVNIVTLGGQTFSLGHFLATYSEHPRDFCALERKQKTRIERIFSESLFQYVLRKNRRRFPSEQTFHHNVYVILLDDAVTKHPSIVRLNPRREPSKPCVYVGMTGLPIDQRFENHKNGYKSAWVVKKYGVRLMPELYEHLNPMPFQAAVQMEIELAEDLRAEGYTVTGGK